VVVEKAAAVAAVEAVVEAAKAAKRERLAAFVLEVQQLQAELGSGSGTPDAEETMRVVWLDVDPRIALCCRACTCAQLLDTRCPVCRGPIEGIAQVFT
jgi:hypothetical protein